MDWEGETNLIMPERSEHEALNVCRKLATREPAHSAEQGLGMHRQLILTILRCWAEIRMDNGGVIPANPASFPVSFIENTALMTTRTTYVLWHILLPVCPFPSFVSGLVSAANEWGEHGIWECDTTTCTHVHILPHTVNQRQAMKGKSNWDNQYHQVELYG